MSRGWRRCWVPTGPKSGFPGDYLPLQGRQQGGAGQFSFLRLQVARTGVKLAIVFSAGCTSEFNTETCSRDYLIDAVVAESFQLVLPYSQVSIRIEVQAGYILIALQARRRGRQLRLIRAPFWQPLGSSARRFRVKA